MHWVYLYIYGPTRISKAWKLLFSFCQYSLFRKHTYKIKMRNSVLIQSLKPVKYRNKVSATTSIRMMRIFFHFAVKHKRYQQIIAHNIGNVSSAEQTASCRHLNQDSDTCSNESNAATSKVFFTTFQLKTFFCSTQKDCHHSLITPVVSTFYRQ